ncbi:hypothetical protein GCM10025770_38040 [Viridibacterium curvum]|uniref:Uncharacterized protein n=1 Tax=Viridibacterium curvum TaxID=1101404 RepID=A0ABP9R788_9RHOO
MPYTADWKGVLEPVKVFASTAAREIAGQIAEPVTNDELLDEAELEARDDTELDAWDEAALELPPAEDAAAAPAPLPEPPPPPHAASARIASAVAPRRISNLLMSLSRLLPRSCAKRRRTYS